MKRIFRAWWRGGGGLGLNLCLSIAFFAVILLMSSLNSRAAAVAMARSDSTNILQIHGGITWRGLLNGLPSGVDRVSRFSVVAKGCTYRIDQISPPDASRDSVYYDGTNWYTESVPPGGSMASNVVWFTEKGMVTIPLNKPVKRNPTLAVSLTIEPLLRRSPYLFPVWLPFGGSCHFANETAPEIPSVFFQGNGRNSGPLLQFELVRADRVFSTDGNLSRYTDYWNEPPFGVKDPSASGLTNIDFHVLGWTNVGSVKIPASFRFIRYFVSPNAKPQYYKSMDGIGQIDRIERLETAAELRPTLATNTSVVHFRSHEWEAVTYIAVDARLKRQQEVDEEPVR